MWYARDSGYKFSVSMEPMLDKFPGFVIDRAREAGAASVWLGRANRLRAIVAMNLPGNFKMRDAAQDLAELLNDDYIQKLYDNLKDDPLIRWKDSIKKVVGIPLQIEVSK